MTRRGSIDALAARLTGLYDAREARSIALAAVAELSGLSPSALLTDPEAELAVEGLEESAARLAAGEPLQYVVGHTEFYGRRFAVREGVLIPRPETEELVDAILHGEREARRLLDVGTGSGCIAASLALGMPGTEVFAADISDDALTVAAENFQQLGAAVTLRKADALNGLEGLFRSGSTRSYRIRPTFPRATARRCTPTSATTNPAWRCSSPTTTPSVSTAPSPGRDGRC